MMSDLFYRNTRLLILTICLIVVAGINAVYNLTTRQYPKSDLAVIKVTTAYIGADADLVRGYITTPLERAIASADGIEYLSSTSKQSVSEINAHLKLI